MGYCIKLSIFHLQCYSIMNSQKATWDGARNQCKAMGGNLASILSRHVQGFVFFDFFQKNLIYIYIIPQTIQMSDMHQNEVTNISTFNHQYVLHFQYFWPLKWWLHLLQNCGLVCIIHMVIHFTGLMGDQCDTPTGVLK